MADEGSTKPTYSAEEWKYSHPAMKALHDLTPGGSEFAGDPKYCADYIRKREHSQHELIVAKFKENKELKAELARVRGLLQRAAGLLRMTVKASGFFDEEVEQRIKEFLAESADIGKLDTADNEPSISETTVSPAVEGQRTKRDSPSGRRTTDLAAADKSVEYSSQNQTMCTQDAYDQAKKVVTTSGVEMGKVNRVEKCFYCGRLISQLANDGNICTSPTNISEPDTVGNRHHVTISFRGSAETGGEKAAPGVLIPRTLWQQLFDFLNRRMERDRWQNDQHRLREGLEDCAEPNRLRGADGCAFCIGSGKRVDDAKGICVPCECIRPARQHVGSFVRELEPNFPRISQNQTVSSGVEGAHEGTTADKSEPEKLNNTQKCICLPFPKPYDGCPVHGRTVSNVALAESSLSSPPPNPQLVIACLEEAIELFELDDEVNTPGTDSWLWKLKSEQALIAYAEAESSPNFRQSPSLTESGAESAHSGKQNAADKSGLLPTQLPKEK